MSTCSHWAGSSNFCYGMLQIEWYIRFNKLVLLWIGQLCSAAVLAVEKTRWTMLGVEPVRNTEHAVETSSQEVWKPQLRRSTNLVEFPWNYPRPIVVRERDNVVSNSMEKATLPLRQAKWDRDREGITKETRQCESYNRKTATATRQKQGEGMSSVFPSEPRKNNIGRSCTTRCLRHNIVPRKFHHLFLWVNVADLTSLSVRFSGPLQTSPGSD